MYLADFLSRAPLAYSGYQSDTPDSNYTIFQVNRLTRIFSVFENVNMCNGVGVTQFKLDLIRQATLNDDNLTVLKRVILDGWPDKKELTPQCIHHYWVFRDELSVCDNIIFRGCRVLIPKATRPMMLQRIHASHTRAESCVRKARDILFWPQMSQVFQHSLFFISSYLESNLCLCCVSLQGHFFLPQFLIFTFMRGCEQQEVSACCVAKLHLICILFDHSLFTLLRFLVFADGNL